MFSWPTMPFSPPQTTKNVGNILGWVKNVLDTPLPAEEEVFYHSTRLTPLDLESLYAESLESTGTVIVVRLAPLGLDDPIVIEEEDISPCAEIEDYTAIFDAARKRPRLERIVGGLKKKAKNISGKACSLVTKIKKFGLTLYVFAPAALRTGNPLECAISV
jgi:hypothetical protein